MGALYLTEGLVLCGRYNSMHGWPRGRLQYEKESENVPILNDTLSQ